MVVTTAAQLLIAITLLCHVLTVHPYVCRPVVEISVGSAALVRKCPWSPNSSITSSPAVELMKLASVQQRPNRSDIYANDIMMRPHRWGGPVVGPLFRRLSIILVSIVSVVVLRLFNRFQVIRENTLKHLMFHRPKGRGLLTVSNHQSVVDDPGLWGALLPFWRISPEQMRWSLCTDNVFFYSRWLTPFLASGNGLPLDRFGSLDQPMLQRFHEKLKRGSWCHLYSEGRVMQNWRFSDPDLPVLGPFKHGVGKIIAHSYPNIPIVLPVYHKGMDQVIPEKVLDDGRVTSARQSMRRLRPSTPMSLMPRTGNTIECYIGEPIDFTEDVKKFVEAYPYKLTDWRSTLESLQLYEHLTNKIREAVLKLEAEAYQRKSRSN